MSTIARCRILITGSSGLVGSALAASLQKSRAEVVFFDTRASGDAHGDIRDFSLLQKAVEGVDGVVHLAAVSRVIWGERDPALCWETNVGGMHNMLSAVTTSPRAPWLIFASSREVYGQPDSLPATEDAPLSPVNIYGRTKIEGERLVTDARAAGLRACIIRLSNVFGSTLDHADRVVPAFARAAALGNDLRVDGLDHTFDFTHIDDVARGIAALVELLVGGGAPPPPIHFVGGRPTTLGELAKMAASIGGAGSRIVPSSPRNFDVAQFYGDPSRAKKILGWEPKVRLEDGLSRLIEDFRGQHR